MLIMHYLYNRYLHRKDVGLSFIIYQLRMVSTSKELLIGKLRKEKKRQASAIAVIKIRIGEVKREGKGEREGRERYRGRGTKTYDKYFEEVCRRDVLLGYTLTLKAPPPLDLKEIPDNILMLVQQKRTCIQLTESIIMGCSLFHAHKTF